MEELCACSHDHGIPLLRRRIIAQTGTGFDAVGAEAISAVLKSSTSITRMNMSCTVQLLCLYLRALWEVTTHFVTSSYSRLAGSLRQQHRGCRRFKDRGGLDNKWNDDENLPMW